MTSKEFTSVWTREPRQSKSPGLSRDQIVEAAVELLDAEGLEALSMRKLGTRLGSGATSIYWHVANKQELLELAFDEVWGEVSVPDPAQVGWRAAIWASSHSMREVILRHPWSSGLIGRMPAIGPKALAIGERWCAAYELAGFRGLEIAYVNATVVAYVFGMVVPEVAWVSVASSPGFDMDGMHETVEKASAAYPKIHEQIKASPREPDQMSTRNNSFDFGLTSVLDGLEQRLVT